MNVISGDLVAFARDGTFDVIVHGCNCQCVMGAGIAKAIRSAFPAAYDADRATAKGDMAKLGTISVAEVGVAPGRLSVVNAYTQYHYRGPGPLVEYSAVRSCMASLKERFAGLRIGYPRIGAGLAGGDWSVIREIIRGELAGEDHTLVKFAG
jgi:O-acetyl-ADP-ribose deacetylase (regulator of RNase III)